MKPRVITKEKFREMAFPSKGQGKDIAEAPMELMPVNKGLINGNLYHIEVKDLEDEVILTKVERVEDDNL